MVGPSDKLQLLFVAASPDGGGLSWEEDTTPLLVGPRLHGLGEGAPHLSVSEAQAGDPDLLADRIESEVGGAPERDRPILLHSSLWHRAGDLPRLLFERGFKRVAILLEGESEAECCREVGRLLSGRGVALPAAGLLAQLPLPACLAGGGGRVEEASPGWRQLAADLGEKAARDLLVRARERVPTWGGEQGPVVVPCGDRWFEVWRSPYLGRWDPALWMVIEATDRIEEVVDQRQAKLWLENLITSLNGWVTDPERLARSFCRLVARRTGLEKVLLFHRQEPGRLTLLGGEGEDPEGWQGIELPLDGPSPVAWVARTGKPITCRESTLQAGVSLEPLRALGVEACTCLPLNVQGQSVGVLVLVTAGVGDLDPVLRADLEVACLHAGVLLYAGGLYRHSRGAAADWERVFHAVEQPMLLLDRKGRVVRANQAAARLAEAADPGALVGAAVDRVLYGGGEVAEGCMVERVIRSGRSAVGFRTLGPGQDRYHVAVHPLAGPGGAPTGAVLFARNVTKELDLEGRFRGMVDNANALFVVADPWGTIQFAAGIWETMLGYAPGEVLGRNVCDFVHRHDRTKVVEALSHLGAKPGRIRDFLYRAPHRNGGIRWHQVTGYSEADRDEAPERVYLFIADVTDLVASREKSELQKAELRQQRDMMARFLAMGAAIHEEKDLESKLGLVCRAVDEAGLFRRAVLGVFGRGGSRFRVVAHRGASLREISLVEEVDSFIGPDLEAWDADRYRISNSLFIPREARLPGEVGGRSHEGWERADNWREEDLLVVPLRNSEQRIIGMLVVDDPPDGRRPGDGTVRALELLVGMAVSAVEHSLLQEDVDRWERDWDAVFSQVDELVGVVDREGVLVRANAALASFLGTTVDQLVMQPAPPLLRLGERPGSNPLMDTLLTGCASNHRIEWDRRSLQVTIRPWSEVGKAPRASGAVWVGRQAGEVKASSRLEAVGSLAGGIVHDFNNMLCAIQGHISLMIVERDARSESTQALRQIEQACVSAAKMVKRLRNFSREPGSDRREVDLTEVVRSTMDVLRHTIPTTIGFRLELPPAPIWVRAEEGALDELVANLVINARDAMEEAGTIGLSLAVEAGTARLLVEDTGAGIPAEHLDHIFDPWFTTKQDRGGSGLGLAVVRGVVADLGGGVAVRSTPGQGAAFEITLPCQSREPAAEPEDTTPNTISPEEPPRGRGETVLVVDDEEPILALVCDILQFLGYRYLAAGDAMEALKVFRERVREIDLVITDFTMPEMTGRELAARLKEINPTVPVILSSGLLPEGVGGGPEDDFLSKPFQVNDVARCLAAFLKP